MKLDDLYFQKLDLPYFLTNYSFFNFEIVANSNSSRNISSFYLINWIFPSETIQGRKYGSLLQFSFENKHYWNDLYLLTSFHFLIFFFTHSFTSKRRNPLKMPGSPYKERYKTSRKQMKLYRFHQNLLNLNSLTVKVSEEKLFLKTLSKIFQTA